jgi:hypothetical protein
MPSDRWIKRGLLKHRLLALQHLWFVNFRYWLAERLRDAIRWIEP